MATSSTAEIVRTTVAPLVADHGLDLYDVEDAGGTIRILVDREGGVDLEVIADLTRAVSSALDDADPLPGGYMLEVSSPGVERPLRTPAHFAAAVGSAVTVKTVAGTEGERRAEGTLVASDGETATIETDSGTRTIGLDQIERARTVFVWGPAPKPGGAKKNKAPKGAPTRKATKP